MSDSAEGNLPDKHDQDIVGEDLVQSPPQKQAGTTVLDLDGLLPKPLQLHEDLTEGCGGQLWPAGMVLAKYMLRTHRESLGDKKIVELGAGGGLVGLAVAQSCNITKPLFITDQAPMLALMRRNILLNGLEAVVDPLVLDWGSTPVPEALEHPDIILAADCVYFEPAFPLLLATLVALSDASTVVYFCFKRRRRADIRFMKASRKAFDVRELDDPDGAAYGRENIFLYAMVKKQDRSQGP